MYRRQAAATCATIVALVAIVAPSGAAHAQAEGELIPAWVKSVFAYYVNGQITEAELIAALEFLINENIIHVSSTAPAAAPPPPGQHTAEWRIQKAIHRTDAALNTTVTSMENIAILNHELEMPLGDTAIGVAFDIQKHIDNTGAPIDHTTADAAERMADAAERMADAAERMANSVNTTLRTAITASIELAFLPEVDRIPAEKARDAELELLNYNLNNKMIAIDDKHAATDNMLTEYKTSPRTMSEVADMVDAITNYGTDMFDTASEFFDQSTEIFLKYADG